MLPSRKKELILFCAILCIGAFFRFYSITALPPGLYPDEAVNGNNGLTALSTGNFKVFYIENNGREGLFINMQAFSVWLFGQHPWSLRIVSAVFGFFTILGLYLVTKELLAKKTRGSPFAALAATFFIATSFWHVNFSRIGFRAITIPFFCSFALYFLLKSLRTKKISDILFAGIFTGLGFYTYIAFRFFPFVAAIPLIAALWHWWRNRIRPAASREKSCTPCIIALYVFVVFVVVLPIGLYFLQNPADFFGRGGQVSVFSSPHPFYEFVRSNAITLQMFFFIGDCNPRHNFACRPELFLPVAFFFLIGIIASIREIFKKDNPGRTSDITLFGWFLFMMFPATLTREGLPHALRAIGLIPPVMIYSGIGAWRIYERIQVFLDRHLANPEWQEIFNRLRRLKKETTIIFIAIFFLIISNTYIQYFHLFAISPKTTQGFRADLLDMAEYANITALKTPVYFLANYPNLQYGFPIETEVLRFITDTNQTAKQDQKHIHYLMPQDLALLAQPLATSPHIIIIPMNQDEKTIFKAIREQFPELKLTITNTFFSLQK